MIPNYQWKYISISADGEVIGMDDEQAATQFALSEDNVVIHVAACTVLTAEEVTEEDEDGEEVTQTETSEANIPEQTLYKFD